MIANNLYAGRKSVLIFTMLLPLFFIACSSKEEQAQSHFQSGLSYFENHSYEKARVEFLNVLQRDPKHADAHFYLGLISQKDGELAAVYEMMSKALKLDPNNSRAKIIVAELMIFAKSFDRALTLSDEIIAKDAQDFDGYRIKAAALVGNSQFIEAEKVLDHAEGIKPGDAAVLGLRAVIAKERGRFDEALTLLDGAIAATDDPLQYLILRSKINRDLERVEALLADLQALIMVAPDQPQYAYAFAKILTRQKRYAEAEQTLQALMERQPENMEAKQLLVDTIYLSDVLRAKSLLEEMIAANPRADALRFYKVRLMLKEGDTALAKSLLQEMMAQSPKSASGLKARALLAEVLMVNGERARAIELVLKNLDINNQHEESLLVKAKYDSDNGDDALATASLLTVLRNNPESEKGLIMLGNLYQQAGSPLLADDSFRQVLQINPANEDAAMPVVRNLLASEDLERAEKIIARVLDSQPGDAKLLMFFIQIKLLKKDWRGAMAAVERLAKLENMQAYASFYRGRAWQGSGDCHQAIEHYRAALTQNPNIVPALEGLTQCGLSRGKKSELLDYLTSYKQKYPDVVYGFATAARVYQFTGELAKAVLELEQALARQPDWLEGYATLAGLKDALNDHAGAIASYRAGIAVAPEGDYLRVLLASYYTSLKQPEAAVELYRAVLAQHPENRVARNNLATLLLDTLAQPEHLSEALTLASVFKRSEEAFFLDTYGWALLLNDRAVEAERVLREAAKGAPGEASIQYHFARALMALERYEEARVVLGRAQKLPELDANVAAKLAQSLWQIDEILDSKVSPP